jgi:hypothetical protein
MPIKLITRPNNPRSGKKTPLKNAHHSEETPYSPIQLSFLGGDAIRIFKAKQ